MGRGPLGGGLRPSGIAAAAAAGERGSSRRAPSAHQLASYLGLVPLEDTSGGRDKRRLGSITKQGNAYLRALLTQAAHTILRHKKRNDARSGRRETPIPKRPALTTPSAAAAEPKPASRARRALKPLTSGLPHRRCMDKLLIQRRFSRRDAGCTVGWTAALQSGRLVRWHPRRRRSARGLSEPSCPDPGGIIAGRP
ncbi:transposase [Sorangium sp. So ce296]|uniref:transposase n=1 Tax=Sorangium sp. So ce296 TaxID=3133296 RepID=UPI003F5E9740